MKIVINKSENYKTLYSVDYGECFIPEGSEDDVYIKTRGVCLRMPCYKCVNLSDGSVVEFSELKMVRIVKSEVVIDENV